MSGAARIISVVRTRSEKGAIVDASGWMGAWPFRRPVSYHVGINCDAISLSDGRLHVHRGGWTIAVADFRGASRCSWATLLFPRHARRNEPPRCGRSQPPWVS